MVHSAFSPLSIVTDGLKPLSGYINKYMWSLTLFPLEAFSLSSVVWKVYIQETVASESAEVHVTWFWSAQTQRKMKQTFIKIVSCR